jgi:hypothetical protein
MPNSAIYSQPAVLTLLIASGECSGLCALFKEGL